MSARTIILFRGSRLLGVSMVEEVPGIHEGLEEYVFEEKGFGIRVTNISAACCLVASDSVIYNKNYYFYTMCRFYAIGVKHVMEKKFQKL